ncbi:hypothetical protein G9A89_006816 [Geosiphon pyriformis]|nr:hypothetical protein G9A89_006816 [Geosiphon pyriformis]
MASKTHPEAPSFLTQMSEIDENISNIQKNISRIHDLQTQLLTSTSNYQSRSFNEERELKLQETKTLLFGVKDRIKKIEYENLKISQSDPEYRLRRERVAFIKEKFTNVLEEYRGVEDQYMHQHKERLARQYRVVNPEATQAEIDGYLNNPSSSQGIFQNALLRGEAREAYEEVQKRHEDIKQIEQTIAELAQLFQDMQLQVEAQDEVLVNVQENVGITLVKLETAGEQLQIATDLATAARKKKWILFGIIFTIITIIAIILAIKLSGGSKNNGSTQVITTSAPNPTPTPTPNSNSNSTSTFPSKG